MKWYNNLLLPAVMVMVLASCHGTSSKDYDKNEKNDPSKIDVPSNSDATNPSLADTTKSSGTRQDTTVKK